MIVNAAMLTMKTDEIGAAIWSQKAQQQNACSEYVICIWKLFLLRICYNINVYLEVSYLGSCFPLPVSGSV